MSAAPLAAAANVHIEIPGFKALSEQAHWDACGPIAEIDSLHVCPAFAVPLTEASIVAYRSQYVAAGHWRGNGCYLSDIHWHLTSVVKAPIAAYIAYSATPNLTNLHALVKTHTYKQNPVIIQVLNAQALPHAEQGVKSHFVALGGLDSTLGYLVANGDTTDAIQGPPGAIVPCYWATWQTLVNAKIAGAIAIQRVVAPPKPPDPTPPPPIDTAKALELAREAQTTINELVTVLGG